MYIVVQVTFIKTYTIKGNSVVQNGDKSRCLLLPCEELSDYLECAEMNSFDYSDIINESPIITRYWYESSGSRIYNYIQDGKAILVEKNI